MAFIEAALASTRSLLSSSRAPSLLSSCSSSRFVDYASRISGVVPGRSGDAEVPDVEDSGGAFRTRVSMRRLLTGAISVTDLTSTEWCEKQMEFTLLHGKPKKTAAMKAGCHRHSELEEEVVQRVNISATSEEDCWSVKFLNFFFGVKQLLSSGLTRELPVVGFLEGIWVVGVIDELHMHLMGSQRIFSLLDTKTRTKPTLPHEAQKRNSRLQLMCYKFLWDNNVSSFCADKFLEHFHLNPESILSEEVMNYGAELDITVKKFRDVLVHFTYLLQTLSPSEDLMTIRYEFQVDNSLLGSYTFEFDDDWFKTEVRNCIEFLTGKRDACYVANEERFKCSFCPFSHKCKGPNLPRKRPHSPEK